MRISLCVLPSAARVASACGSGLDRVAQHLATGVEHLADDVTRHLAVGDIDRRLDHRQREAFDAEAVMLDVAPLGRQQMLGQMVRIGIVAQQLGESLLRQLEEPLVMPERVVGIETDSRQLRHW